MRLTDDILKKVFPQSTETLRKRFLPHLQEQMEAYAITDPRQVRAFLAQIGAESGQLHHTVENLNYSASGLRTVFGRYFPTDAIASAYARKPEKIANRVYADRLGNGGEASGDGWRYRGRGLIQTTGKANYQRLSQETGTDFVLQPDLLAMDKFAVMSACAFWVRNGLNETALNLTGRQEDDVFKAITRRINGGYNGLDERRKLYQSAKRWIV